MYDQSCIALTGCCVNLQEHPEIEWYLWIDSDTMIINPTFEMPLKKFKGKDLIIWGNETALLEGDGRNGTASSQQRLPKRPVTTALPFNCSSRCSALACVRIPQLCSQMAGSVGRAAAPGVHCCVTPVEQAARVMSPGYARMSESSMCACRHELRRHAVPENALDGGVPDQGCSAGQDTGARAGQGTRSWRLCLQTSL